MKIVHITINTADLDKSVSFYQDILGLSIARDMRNQGKANIVFLKDQESDLEIELIENKDHPYQGSGISIGFATDQLDAKAEWLKEKDIVPGPVISPNPATRFFYIKDPSGVDIQFIETK